MKVLQIERESNYKRDLFFKIQRILRYVLCIILIAALFGLFGPGILGPTHISNHNVTIIYDKFIRVQTTNALHLKIIPTNQNNKDYIKILSSFDLYNKAYIKSITPSPLFESTENNHLIYYFKKEPNMDNLNIIIVFESEMPGMLHQTIGIDDESSTNITFSQFIYP